MPATHADRARFGARVALATATLFSLIASHSIRETARDALFLTDLPATRLPWAYLAIALGALALGAANRALLGRVSPRGSLVVLLAVAAAVDVGFWWLGASPEAGTLFGLYAWTGLLATAVTFQLWLELAGAFDVAEAKRAFPWITAGGSAGAVGGALLAGALLLVLDTRSLLLASAGLSIGSAFLAFALPPPRREELSARREEAAHAPPISEVFGSGYLRRITVLAIAVAVLTTGIDFAFKHAVEQSIPSEQLGHFFARFHAVANAAALAFELLAASWLLRHLGVTRTLALFPILLLGSAGAFAVFGGLLFAVALKAVDETLRHSLYAASTEVLYQPLSAHDRNAAKTVVESIGKRGGQALASVALLAVAGFGLGAREIGLGLVALAALALFAIRGLRGEYVARFHEQLSGLAGEARTAVPTLELNSLEVLLANLSSPDDVEVLAAIDLLEHYGRTALVSPLLLHHPSQKVVLRALAILETSDHPHLDAIIGRLLGHPDAEVRAAALNAVITRDGAATAPLERALSSDPSPAVRTTAIVALAARHRDPEKARAFLAELLDGGSADQKVAIARALPRLRPAAASDAALRLAADRDPDVPGSLARALAAVDPDPGWIPVLIALLARRDARSAARTALLALGERATAALGDALRDPETDAAVRRHLPRTIHRFGTPAAAEALLRALPDADPEVRYKILRGLGRMRADDPELAIPEADLRDHAVRSLDRAIEMLSFRVGYLAWCGLHAAAAPASECMPDLLGPVLEDKESRALERVFRVLHIIEPRSDFDAIFAALRAPAPGAQAGALELIEHIVDEELRGGVIAMFAVEDPLERLRAATRGHGTARARALADALPAAGDPIAEADRDAVEAALEPLFDEMIADPDPILASIARHRLGELAKAPRIPGGGWAPR